MPVIGERKVTIPGNGYAKDPMHAFAAAFKNTATNVLTESTNDLFSEPLKALRDARGDNTLRNFFIQESADKNGMTAEEYEDHLQMMTEMYENDKEAILEHTTSTDFNPVIGMTFPIHKNILMNNVFDKGAIPKIVTRTPKFTVTMETRSIVAPDGTEVDIFKEQYKIKQIINSTAPVKEMVLTLPENGDTNVLSTLFAASELDDNLSLETSISGVVAMSYVTAGETYYTPASEVPTVDDEHGVVKVVAEADGEAMVVFPVNEKFNPAYGIYDRQIMFEANVPVKSDATTVAPVKCFVSGWTKKNRFGLTSSNSEILGVVLKTRIDTSSAMLRTASVKWSTVTTPIEIPDAIPVNTTLSPDEVKDIGALYQVNQLTKIMSLFKLILGNYKDDTIREKLDESFIKMPKSNKIARTFDFAPREGYHGDHVEWRHRTFMDALDSYVTHMIHVLNDANVTITVFGRDDLIRKITPTEYTYQSPSNIGPVELDFVKTVTTSDKRTYQFISSDKLRDNNNLIIILCPRNTDRFIYRIYDYHMYVSNEIRNAANPALPAIHAYERWQFEEYQPVQGRVKILNPLGLREMIENDDPIGSQLGLNDFDIDNPMPRP